MRALARSKSGTWLPGGLGSLAAVLLAWGAAIWPLDWGTPRGGMCGHETTGGDRQEAISARKRSHLSKKSGKVLPQQEGLSISTPGLFSPARAKLMAIRWSS